VWVLVIAVLGIEVSLQDGGDLSRLGVIALVAKGQGHVISAPFHHVVDGRDLVRGDLTFAVPGNDSPEVFRIVTWTYQLGLLGLQEPHAFWRRRELQIEVAELFESGLALGFGTDTHLCGSS
jgi:hypothetical protein